MNARGVLPHNLSAIAALLAIGASVALALWNETPVGSIEGRVYLVEQKKGLEGVRVVLAPLGESRERRRTVTGPDGRFRIGSIAVGAYRIIAETRAHEARGAFATVSEAETSHVELALERNQPLLELAQHQWTFSSDETPRVAVRGYVNAARDADTIRLELYRAQLSEVMLNPRTADALEAVGRSWDAPPGLPQALLNPESGNPPARIDSREVPLTEADREGFYFQRVSLGRLPVGLYLLNISHRQPDEEARTCAWVLVTDTALVLKKAKQDGLVYAVHLRTGEPLPGTRIRAFREGSLLADAFTDSRGLLRLALPAEESESKVILVASRGQDEAVLGHNSYERESSGEFAAHLYTDRPIYRPGQRIYYKGILRRSLDPGFRYAVPAGEPVAMEIRDPSGALLHTARLAAGDSGSFHGQADLPREAATGVYSLIATVRGERKTHDIVIASYKKPEYAVSLLPAKPRYVRGDRIEVTISGEYYFGAPVTKAAVEYTVYSSPDWAAEFPEEYGYDPEVDPEPAWGRSESYYGEMVAEGRAELDDSGRATIRFVPKLPSEPDAPQEHVITVRAEVVDQAQRRVEETAEIRVTAGEFRLSVRPEGYLARPGEPVRLIVAAKDFENRPVSGVPVTVTPIYHTWRSGKDTVRELAPISVTTGVDGTAALTAAPDRAGDLQLRARAVDSAGRTVYASASVWVATDEGGEMDVEYADLSLVTDKRNYSPGETARVLLNAQHAGQTALLTVEGGRVYQTLLVPMRSRSEVVRIPVLPEYGPNVYLAACYVKQKKFASSQTPLRVELPDREIRIQIEPDRAPPGKPKPDALPVYAPGERIRYRIQATDSQGRPAPCEMSFGVVDESIYALREDDPAALRNAFYGWRYPAVETAFSFAVQYLGDADKAEPIITARKRFPDTVYWNPVVKTDAQGRATVSFPFQDSLTTWRATAIAHTATTALGRAVSRVRTAREFLVRLESPRFLTEFDTARIAAFVHNETGAPQTALVRLRGAGISIQGDEQQQVQIEPGKVGEVSWRVLADRYGEAKLTVTAWTPAGPGTKQHTDGVEIPLPVRPHGRERFESFSGEVTDASPQREIVRLDPNAVPGASGLTIRITPSVAGALAGALEYLVGYPYGCTEQTMSRFLPTLLAERILRASGQEVSTLGNIQAMVREGLARLYKMQRPSGGWGWWQNGEEDPWMTAYVLQGLAIARSSGYPVTEEVLRRGAEAALKMAGSAKPENRAFLLYAVALSGARQGAAARRGLIDATGGYPESLAYAILLNRLLGNPAAPTQISSRTLLGRLEDRSDQENGLIHWKPRISPEWSAVSSTAAALRALIAVNPRDPRIPAALRWLMVQRTGTYWHSTRDTAAVLLALTDYLESQPRSMQRGEIRISLNGNALQSFALTPALMREREVALRIPASELKTGRNEVQIERSGGRGAVFYSVQLRQTIGGEDLPAVGAAGLKVAREYLRMDRGGRLAPARGAFRTGDRIRVRLRVTVPREIAYALIEDAFPAGFEATERGTADEDADYDWAYWWSAVDVRDDRIAFFVPVLRKGEHVLEYNLRAQTPGTYHALPALLESMYAPDLHAESAETRLEVNR